MVYIYIYPMGKYTRENLICFFNLYSWKCYPILIVKNKYYYSGNYNLYNNIIYKWTSKY